MFWGVEYADSNQAQWLPIGIRDRHSNTHWHVCLAKTFGFRADLSEIVEGQKANAGDGGCVEGQAQNVQLLREHPPTHGHHSCITERPCTHKPFLDSQ